MNDETKHPWDEFLKARYKAILWMRDNRKYTNKEISEALSMDERQVYSIINAMSKFE